MATMDAGNRSSNTLPSISHLDLDKINSDRVEHSKYGMMNGLSISTSTLTSPTTMYPGPPPPYSSAPSTTSSGPNVQSGYISPPESTTRRSTRDEKESPGTRKSLPSILEALGDQSMSFPAPGAISSQHQPVPTTSTVGQTFPDAPKGPVNPFSQPSGPPPVLRDVFSNSNTKSSPDSHHAKSTFPPASATDPRQSVSQHFGYPGSPRSNPTSSFRSSSLTTTSYSNHNDHHPPRSPHSYDQQRQSYHFPPPSSAAPTAFPAHEPFQFSAGLKPEDLRGHYARPASDITYGDTVKRHLDVFDAELGLNEISEAADRALGFSRTWATRYQQNRSGYYQDSLPSLQEIDDMLRHSHRIFENLSHLRETVIAQQNALSEQRARMARGSQMDEEYHDMGDEYKGGFATSDAKKRRGKAAPPGRCHSCNRAETPEWRRGPDGARTLCNACGLHYAKLTRKMGVNKAAALTGSNLRPKSMESTRP